MDKVLKGNFKTRKEVQVNTKQQGDLEERFEKEALSRLGGSIAYVSRKKVDWNLGNGQDES